MWRDNLDSTLKEDFEVLLKRVSLEKKAYQNAKDVSKAQIWCALAVLSKEIENMRIRVTALEKNIKNKKNLKLKKALERL
jgi:hypothetical protein